jgi:hypothetical protein
MVMDQVDHDPQVFTMQDYRNKFGMSERTASRRLRMLVDDGRLIRIKVKRRSPNGHVRLTAGYKLAYSPSRSLA